MNKRLIIKNFCYYNDEFKVLIDIYELENNQFLLESIDLEGKIMSIQCREITNSIMNQFVIHNRRLYGIPNGYITDEFNKTRYILRIKDRLKELKRIEKELNYEGRY